MEASTMSTTISTLGSVVTGAASWMTTIAETIAGNNLMLLSMGVVFVGIAISWVARLVRGV